MEAVIVALIVALGGVFGQWLLRRQEFKRQDEVAARAEQVAQRLLASNERAARSATATNQKLDVIHGLVNSNLTSAMQAELDATIRVLLLMREVVALKRAAGQEPSPEAIGAIKATEAKIEELTVVISDRLKAAESTETEPGEY